MKKAELFDLYKEAAAVKQVKLAFSAKDHPQNSGFPTSNNPWNICILTAVLWLTKSGTETWDSGRGTRGRGIRGCGTWGCETRRHGTRELENLETRGRGTRECAGAQ